MRWRARGEPRPARPLTGTRWRRRAPASSAPPVGLDEARRACSSPACCARLAARGGRRAAGAGGVEVTRDGFDPARRIATSTSRPTSAAPTSTTPSARASPGMAHASFVIDAATPVVTARSSASSRRRRSLRRGRNTDSANKTDAQIERRGPSGDEGRLPAGRWRRNFVHLTSRGAPGRALPPVSMRRGVGWSGVRRAVRRRGAKRPAAVAPMLSCR